jgi:hypothetical protein
MYVFTKVEVFQVRVPLDSLALCLYGECPAVLETKMLYNTVFIAVFLQVVPWFKGEAGSQTPE